MPKNFQIGPTNKLQGRWKLFQTCLLIAGTTKINKKKDYSKQQKIFKKDRHQLINKSRKQHLQKNYKKNQKISLKLCYKIANNQLNEGLDKPKKTKSTLLQKLKDKEKRKEFLK